MASRESVRRAIYASRSRNMLIALKLLRIVLDRCLNKPPIIVYRGPLI